MARCQRSHWHLSTWLVIFYGKVNKAQEPPSVAKPGYPTRVKGCCEVKRRNAKTWRRTKLLCKHFLHCVTWFISGCLTNFSLNKHDYRLHSNATTENRKLDKWEYDYVNMFVTVAKPWFYFQCGILLRCSLLHLFMFFTTLFTWFKMARVELCVTVQRPVFVRLMLWKGWRMYLCASLKGDSQHSWMTCATCKLAHACLWGCIPLQRDKRASGSSNLAAELVSDCRIVCIYATRLLLSDTLLGIETTGTSWAVPGMFSHSVSFS